MKNYLKNEIKHLPMIVIVSIIFCGINTLANNHLFNSKDVDYDNSNTHIESTNVGDAIDELFDAANNFTTYDTRLQGVESKVGTGTLNTTAQNLIGGVNELNTKLTKQDLTLSDYFTPASGVSLGSATYNFVKKVSPNLALLALDGTATINIGVNTLGTMSNKVKASTYGGARTSIHSQGSFMPASVVAIANDDFRLYSNQAGADRFATSMLIVIDE